MLRIVATATQRVFLPARFLAEASYWLLLVLRQIARLSLHGEIGVPSSHRATILHVEHCQTKRGSSSFLRPQIQGAATYMPSITFWNVEHLSQAAVDIAEAAKIAQERTVDKFTTTIAASAASSISSGDAQLTAAVRRSSVINSPKGDPSDSRLERLEKRAFVVAEELRQKADRLENKFELSQDLTLGEHVFFCEVQSGHAGAENPLLRGLAAGAGTLHYLYYQKGKVSAFTHCPISDGWYPPVLIPTLPKMDRVPKGVVINGARGHAAGQPIRFCFWHAPAGNDGKIVATMANGLALAGHPFVLFGDLNAEPGFVKPHLAAAVEILEPATATRISGKILDYAITNEPGWFNKCRALYTVKKFSEIKEKTGSDHMVMLLDSK